jgi:hypothetical protein
VGSSDLTCCFVHHLCCAVRSGPACDAKIAG